MRLGSGQQKPLPSTFTLRRESHAVFGSAPVKRNPDLWQAQIRRLAVHHKSPTRQLAIFRARSRSAMAHQRSLPRARSSLPPPGAAADSTTSGIRCRQQQYAALDVQPTQRTTPVWLTAVRILYERAVRNYDLNQPRDRRRARCIRWIDVRSICYAGDRRAYCLRHGPCPDRRRDGQATPTTLPACRAKSNRTRA